MAEIKSGRVASFEYVEPEGKSTFSKGMWKWDENISGDRIGISDAEGSDVLCVNHSEGIVIPREKDAHLIAAAPDLYEALVDVMAEISFLGNEVHYFGTTERFDAARVALAKARGES